MKWSLLFLINLSMLISSCASHPPMPPEPKGPLVTVNVQQEHKTFEVKKNADK